MSSPQEIAMRILENGGGGGGGESWVRPADWPVLGKPKENQIIMLVNLMRIVPYSVRISWEPLSTEDFGFTVDWGDGIVESYTKDSLRGSLYIQHLYYDTKEAGEKIWHTGPRLNNGDRVFVITVTTHNVRFYGAYANSMDIHIGKSLELRYDSFRGCRMLKHIKFFDWEINELTYKGGNGVAGLFYGLSSLESFESTKPFTKNIEAKMFENTSLLKTVEGLDECETIGDYAFKNAGIVKLDTPHLNYVGQYAFDGAINLCNIDHAENWTYGSSAFRSCYYLPNNPTIPYPDF